MAEYVYSQDAGAQARESKILEETDADRQGDSQYNTMNTTTVTSGSAGSQNCNGGNELTTRQQKNS